MACGWFGIQTWVGGSSLYEICATLFARGADPAPPIAWLGISLPQLAGFGAFWLLQVCGRIRDDGL